MGDDGKSLRDGLSCSVAEPSIQILGRKVGCVEIIYSTKKNWRRPKKNEISRLQGGGWRLFCLSLLRHLAFVLMMHQSRARRALDPLSVPPLTNRRQDRPSKPNGLTKQTFSTQVYLPGAHAPRKWHIVAYFSVQWIYLVIGEDILLTQLLCFCSFAL